MDDAVTYNIIAGQHIQRLGRTLTHNRLREAHLFTKLYERSFDTVRG